MEHYLANAIRGRAALARRLADELRSRPARNALLQIANELEVEAAKLENNVVNIRKAARR